MKKLILILFLVSSSVYSEANTDQKNKLWTFTFIRNSTYLFPYEKYEFRDTFGGYRNKGNETVNNFEFSFKKRFQDSNFSVYTDFLEFNKRSFSQQFDFYQNNQLVATSSVSIGDYFRSQIRFGFLYSLTSIPNFSLILGTRYIKSELTDTFPLTYSIRFGQKYIGPELGFEYQSDKYANFFVAFRISLFQLYGRIYNNYSFSALNTDQGYISVNINPYTKYIGSEIYLKTGYYFTENAFMTIGLKSIVARVLPDDMRVYSGDTRYDTLQNIEYGLRGNYTKSDAFQSVVIEFGANV
ncbi:hypothetical protein LEP1GSC202_3511 [Leptospira yanagawae serovar Saopaulo str. Sao Paulo = ATCC 700523]|uniref:Outer membrane protein, TIGR04327 family n=1 Tax=Leptospira yanagawae serovar Saopaulo str. Sao Paulo = ATCC 700523 TaxID=1249483 RepID=A0A5E8H8X5_9LEPT|nr:hypothetical protein [Leptospira yanagawae]EOQ87921.1 hypothetical protein LEP1GSC202_3511 [Leptospira yanagawae serovar Saopaulo str. Sao Paulo = ATCC 700523]